MPTAIDPISADRTQFLLNANKEKTGFGLDRTYLSPKDGETHQWQLVTEEMIPAIITQLPQDTSCTRCDQESKTKLWFDCWEDPLKSDMLETENLCHCGGELYLEEIPNNTPKKFGWVCEKCNWVKPHVRFSGGTSGLI